ncbi:MAG: hypothetical protein CO034_00940 [Parcubacteria group bacterium CG_4_9_14_0_2_um_filter_35_11]|nr:MAG: hypothetical protein COS98_02545 [Parcubacteria group bacterium CG07_land_8_20_14_0_80_35_11]PJC47890.1 MAG: hypothetical protein CO034_00940 [Parcubacteria group bacterium CG_4_9_14_0_2_um_filter_35_11]
MNYELSFLIPILDLKKREELLKKIKEEVIKLKGKPEDEFIEKKFFAYPVKGCQEGFLGQINFSLEKNRLKEFQDYLKTNKEIIRIILERKGAIKEVTEAKRERRKPILKKPVKKEKVKIEELEKKLEEMLK